MGNYIFRRPELGILKIASSLNYYLEAFHQPLLRPALNSPELKEFRYTIRFENNLFQIYVLFTWLKSWLFFKSHPSHQIHVLSLYITLTYCFRAHAHPNGCMGILHALIFLFLVISCHTDHKIGAIIFVMLGFLENILKVHKVMLWTT